MKLADYDHLWTKRPFDHVLLEVPRNRNPEPDEEPRILFYNLAQPEETVSVHPRARKEVIRNMLEAGVRVITLDEELEDAAREFFRRRAYAEHVILGGLESLVRRWEKVAASIHRGRWSSRYEYLNDMDGRRILTESFERFPHHVTDDCRVRTREADERVRARLVACDRCIWGEEAAERNEYTPTRDWYYFAYPDFVDPKELFPE